MTKGREAPRGASRPFARAGLSAVPVKVAGLRLLPGSGLVITALPETGLAEDLGRLLRRHAGRLRLGWSRSCLRGCGLRCRLRFGLRARRGGAADLRRGELDRAVGAHAGSGTQVGELVVAALDHAYVAVLGVDVEPVPAHRPHERDGRGVAVETDVYRRQTSCSLVSAILWGTRLTLRRSTPRCRRGREAASASRSAGVGAGASLASGADGDCAISAAVSAAIGAMAAPAGAAATLSLIH